MISTLLMSNWTERFFDVIPIKGLENRMLYSSLKGIKYEKDFKPEEARLKQANTAVVVNPNLAQNQYGSPNVVRGGSNQKNLNKLVQDHL